MKRRDFFGMGVAAGAAALLPIGRLAAAASDSSQAAADLPAVKLSGGFGQGSDRVMYLQNIKPA